MKWSSPSLWNRLRPDGMGECKSIGIFAAAKMTHLSDDKTVAKMGHPVVVVRSNGGPPPPRDFTVGLCVGVQAVCGGPVRCGPPALRPSVSDQSGGLRLYGIIA